MCACTSCTKHSSILQNQSLDVITKAYDKHTSSKDLQLDSSINMFNDYN